MPLFAILLSGDPGIRRIGLAPELNDTVKRTFARQLTEFAPAGTGRIPFSGRLAADESELSVIDNFRGAEHLIEVLDAPISVDLLKEDDFENVKGIVAVSDSSPDQILLQSFDARQILAKGRLAMVLISDTFTRLENAGLTIKGRIDGVLHRSTGALEFRDLAAMRRIFDMSAHYREATAADLSKFSALPQISIDRKFLETQADTWILRKVALVMDTDMLSVRPLHEIVQIAVSVGLTLHTTSDVDGNIKLSIPSDKKCLKTILRFLDDDYLSSLVSDRRYVSNSKRPTVRV